MEAFIYDHMRTPRGKGRPDGALHEVPSVQLVTQLLEALQDRHSLDTPRCLEETVIETSEDGDLGAVYGWRFPAWAGGPLSCIDTVGIAKFVTESDRLAQKFGPRFVPSAWTRGARAGVLLIGESRPCAA